MGRLHVRQIGMTAQAGVHCALSMRALSGALKGKLFVLLSADGTERNIHIAEDTVRVLSFAWAHVVHVR